MKSKNKIQNNENDINSVTDVNPDTVRETHIKENDGWLSPTFSSFIGILGCLLYIIVFGITLIAVLQPIMAPTTGIDSRWYIPKKWVGWLMEYISPQEKASNEDLEIITNSIEAFIEEWKLFAMIDQNWPKYHTIRDIGQVVIIGNSFFELNNYDTLFTVISEDFVTQSRLLGNEIYNFGDKYVMFLVERRHFLGLIKKTIREFMIHFTKGETETMLKEAKHAMYYTIRNRDAIYNLRDSMLSLYYQTELFRKSTLLLLEEFNRNHNKDKIDHEIHFNEDINIFKSTRMFGWWDKIKESNLIHSTNNIDIVKHADYIALGMQKDLMKLEKQLELLNQTSQTYQILQTKGMSVCEKILLESLQIGKSNSLQHKEIYNKFNVFFDEMDSFIINTGIGE